MSKYKASLYNYFFSSINNIVLIINGIIMVPLYLHFMPISVYGAWLASGNIVAMIGLLESGFSEIIIQKLSTSMSKEDELEFLTLSGSNLLTAGVISIGILLFGLCFAPFMQTIVNIDSEFVRPVTIAYILALWSSALTIATCLIGAFSQAWQETKPGGEISFITNFLGIFAMIISLFCGLGVISLGVGYFVRATSNFCGLSIWTFRRWNEKKYKKPIYNYDNIKLLIKDCFYPFLSKLSNVIIGQSQSLILAFFMNPTLAALYDFTSKIVSCLCGFMSMANSSFFAMFSITYAKKDNEESNNTTNTVMQYYSICISAIIIYSIFFSKTIITYWVGAEKFGGDLLLILIVLSLCINQFKMFLQNLLLSAGNFKQSSIIDILSLIVYVSILAFCILKLQQYSIPISLGISSLIFCIIYLWLIKKQIKLNIYIIMQNIVKAFAISVPFIIAYFIWGVDGYNLIRQILSFIIVSLTFISLTFILNKEVYTKCFSLFKASWIVKK